MRHLALDVGDERIGLAVSDETGLLVRPLEVIRRVSGPASFLRIAQLIDQHQVGLLIVGLPLLPDGSEGAQVRSTRAYLRGLEKHVQIPIALWDERESSNRAADIMIENAQSKQRRQKRIDAVAAAVILQSYLDERKEDSAGVR